MAQNPRVAELADAYTTARDDAAAAQTQEQRYEAETRLTDALLAAACEEILTQVGEEIDAHTEAAWAPAAWTNDGHDDYYS